MTHDELRAAIDRVRPHAANLGNASVEDRNALVRAYFAEHPADDGVAVDEAWLKKSGLPCPHGWGYHIDGRLYVVREHPGWSVWAIQPAHEHNGGSMRITKASVHRGAVRRLCSALGITLTE